MGSDSNNSRNELDLSSLNFGPAWAKEKTDNRQSDSKGESRPSQGAERRDRQRPARGSGGPDHRRGKSPHRGDEARNSQRRGDSRRSSYQGGNSSAPSRRPVVEAPDGYTAEVMPIEDGLDRLAKQIMDTARTYSVFDLARLVLQSRERFNVGLQAAQGKTLYRNVLTTATFLSKEEALADFWQSPAKGQLYHEQRVQGEAPSGQFPSVAKCRRSGVFLGPPNHHEYQAKLRELHRERFAHLSFEDFQRQIVVESGEEAVEAWKEAVKTQTIYLPIASLPEGARPSPAPLAESSSLPNEAGDGQDSPVPPAEEQSSAPDALEAPDLSDEILSEIDPSHFLKTRTELERHFVSHHFSGYYKEVSKSWVSGAIPGRLLSPGLLTLLKETVAEERRYPGKLSSLMCRQLSGRHVAVFKVKKKLKAGPSRPHALPDLSTLSERPAALLKWVIQNDGKGIDQLWQEVLPSGLTEEIKREWYRDLHWLLNQGFVMLLEEGTLFFSKKEEPTPTPKAAPKQRKSPPKEKSDQPAPESGVVPKSEEPKSAENQSATTEVEDGEPSSEPA